MSEENREEPDMSKKPENEVCVFGLGYIIKSNREIAKLLDRNNFQNSFLEKKLDKIILLLEKIEQKNR